jgi:hypothetical protein
MPTQDLGYPVGNVVASIDTVVEAGVLHATFAIGEDLQFALGAVDQLLAGSVCPLQRNLRVFFTVSDQKWHLDPTQHAIQMHIFGDCHELVDILGTKDPAHMGPVMRYGEIAVLLQAGLLHVAPVVVGSPRHTTGEPRLEGHGARAVITAQGHTFQADALCIDITAGIQPVDNAAGPVLGVMAGHQIVQTQRFARAGLVDDPRGDTTLGQPARPTRYFISLVESRPLSCTRIGVGPFTPSARTNRPEIWVPS